MMSKSKRGKKRREVGYFLVELESKSKVSEEGREVIMLIKLTTEGEMGKGEREVINCIIMYVVYLREYLHELVAEREVS